MNVVMAIGMRLLMVLCLLAAALACAQEPASVALAPKWTLKQFPGISEIEEQVLALTNEVRKKQRLSTLSASTELRIAARQHSQEMGDAKYFGHESPDARWRVPWQRTYNAGFWGQQVGENIVSVQHPGLKTPKAIAERFLELWMNSPPHKANLLTAKWTLLGVGVVKVRDTYYGTQLFAVPLVRLEEAALSRVAGEMVTLTVEGALRSGTVNIWVNGAHQETLTPRRGAFTAAITYPKKSGDYAIMLGLGKTVVWEATLRTDKPEREMLSGVKSHRAGVVTDTRVETRPFTGLRLTGVIKIAPGAQAYFIRDDAIQATLTANKDGLAAFDCILPKRDTHYVIGFGYAGLREDLLYIDTAAPLNDAFLGRPE